jgi:molecular chaperone IbpA
MNTLMKSLERNISKDFNGIFADMDKFFSGAIGDLSKYNETFEGFSKGYSNFLKTVPMYPPFNIRKIEDNKYVIEVALAGFDKSDVEVSIEGNKLVVKGNTGEADSASTGTYEWRGIANRAFTRTFPLLDNLEVKAAEFVNGLLTINLESLAQASKVLKIDVK